MSSLYKRATPRQSVVLRMIEGAVKNAAHAHPGCAIDDEGIARSISKRAAGTLISGWGSVLAAPRVRSVGSNGELGNRSAAGTRQRVRASPGNMAVSVLGHDHRGASQRSWRAPLRVLHRALGHEAGKARRSGNNERAAALIDVLRLVARYLESETMPIQHKRWEFEP